MEIGRLRTLHELSRRQTMSAVAEALLISPSAFSQQLALLECEAGVQLIERRGRGVHLTLAGKQLASHAERIIGALALAKTELAEMKRVVAGELRVAGFPSVAAALLPNTILELRRKYPGLNLLFDEMEPSESLAALRAWQIDAALVDDLNISASGIERGIETVPLIEDIFHVMLPRNHQLASRPAVRLKDLKDENWATDTMSPAYTHMMKDACQRAGFEPNITARCRGLEVTLSLIKAGCAISIFPGLRVGNHLAGVSIRKLSPEIRRKISVAFRRGEGKHPAIKAFLSQVGASAQNYRVQPVA